MAPLIHDVIFNFPIEATEQDDHFNWLVIIKEEIYYDYRAASSTHRTFRESVQMLEEYSYDRLLEEYDKIESRDGSLMLELALRYARIPH